MIPHIQEVVMSRAQIVAVTAAMLRIAHVDGAGTAEEVALIRSFYGDDAAGPPFDKLLAGYADVRASAADFPEPAARELVLALGMMVAFADGQLSAAETAALQALGADLGVAADRYDHLLALVKDDMLGRLAALPDAGSVARVARELG